MISPRRKLTGAPPSTKAAPTRTTSSLDARLALNAVVDRRGFAAHQLDEPPGRGSRRRALPGDAAIAKHEDA